MIRMILVILGVAATAVGLLGFRGQKSDGSPRVVFWDMKFQPKYMPQAQSPFFGDGRTMRPIVEGTVPYAAASYYGDAGTLPKPTDYGRIEGEDALRSNKAYYDGVNGPDKPLDKPGPDGKMFQRDYVPTIPAEAVKRAGGMKELVKFGQKQYTIQCSVCHGHTGMGGSGETAHGITGRYGMVGIANYHSQKYRDYPDGQIFDVITNGYNTMASYGHKVEVQQRWAIIAYVRALQLSQFADPTLLTQGGAK